MKKGIHLFYGGGGWVLTPLWCVGAGVGAQIIDNPPPASIERPLRKLRSHCSVGCCFCCRELSLYFVWWKALCANIVRPRIRTRFEVSTRPSRWRIPPLGGSPSRAPAPKSKSYAKKKTRKCWPPIQRCAAHTDAHRHIRTRANIICW